jgi:hypothetical protein
MNGNSPSQILKAGIYSNSAEKLYAVEDAFVEAFKESNRVETDVSGIETDKGIEILCTPTLTLTDIHTDSEEGIGVTMWSPFIIKKLKEQESVNDFLKLNMAWRTSPDERKTSIITFRHFGVARHYENGKEVFPIKNFSHWSQLSERQLRVQLIDSNNQKDHSDIKLKQDTSLLMNELIDKNLASYFEMIATLIEECGAREIIMHTGDTKAQVDLTTVYAKEVSIIGLIKEKYKAAGLMSISYVIDIDNYMSVGGKMKKTDALITSTIAIKIELPRLNFVY